MKKKYLFIITIIEKNIFSKQMFTISSESSLDDGGSGKSKLVVPPVLSNGFNSAGANLA